MANAACNVNNSAWLGAILKCISEGKAIKSTETAACIVYAVLNIREQKQCLENWCGSNGITLSNEMKRAKVDYLECFQQQTRRKDERF